ncbi:glutathione synthetase [Scrofimicrobium sp. R131]|uniref:Glutathione synthetase n=1 Tax=Scrofimicrobium appendicitidis TaxID=3079930 RepID=A0AAU7V9I7_9ACTO
MSKPRVTLATAAQKPNLYPGETGLLDALASRGVEPRIAVWNDPSVNWDEAGLVVVRSVVDYATDREGFLKWADSLPRVLNHADILRWNSDKHYLMELEKRGLPTIKTTWLSAEKGYTKHQVHSRFPAAGDFVVKPAVSSGVRDVGRYSAINIPQRQAAMEQVMRLLRTGRDVMIQRYQEEVELLGERSLVFLNGLLSHTVDKTALLSRDQVTGQNVQTVDVSARAATDEELRWGEDIRVVLHAYVRERMGRDEQFLFNRVDIVPDGKGSFFVMEVALVDADLYLGSTNRALDNFADAITMRAFW